MKYRFKHVTEYIALRMATAIVRILPLRAALALGWLVAAGAHFIGRVHVERTCGRIRQVFGSRYTDKEIRRIAWIAWRNLFFNGVEALRFSMLTPEAIRRQPLTALEPKLKQVLESCKGGFILATPHMGNWELAGIAADLVGIPLFVIVHRQKNPLVNDYINRMRRTFSMEVLLRESKRWKGVADRLRQGKVLAILPDINVRAGGVTVDYLNNKATVAPGTARFARLANCPVYPVVVRRIGWTRHEAVLLDPVTPDPGLDLAEDQQRIMQEIMTGFTAEICKTPGQYFWFNKRWVLDPLKKAET
jgi:KDO2-lipid IV(A) lauroyltransferase